MTNQLNCLRGLAYYTRLKIILTEFGEQLAEDARQQEKITPVVIGALALKYSLNFKATCEWLEECNVIPTGVYDRLMERGVRVSDIFEAARAVRK